MEYYKVAEQCPRHGKCDWAVRANNPEQAVQVVQEIIHCESVSLVVSRDPGLLGRNGLEAYGEYTRTLAICFFRRG